MDPAIALVDRSAILKRPREETTSPEENPLKKQKTEISACLGRLSSISGLSKDEFSKEILSQLDVINSLFQTLQEAIASSLELYEVVRAKKFDIKIIQNRLSELELTNESEKKEVLQRINTLLVSLKSSENKHKSTSRVTIGLPKEILSLMPLERSCLNSLWESGHVSVKILGMEDELKQKSPGFLESFSRQSQVLSFFSVMLKEGVRQKKPTQEEIKNGVTELVFSKELRKIIDDNLLAMVLSQIMELSDWLQLITYFDFSCCPNLSPEAPKILLTSCPNLRPDSFRGLASEQFYDHMMLVEGEEIRVNKKFISHFSPYFRALFESGFKESIAVKDGMPLTILSSASYEATKDCIDALMGLYDPAQEKNLDRAMAFLLQASMFDMASCLKIGEAAVVRILDSLPSYRINEDLLCRVNKEFYLHFGNERFLGLFHKLSEFAKPIYEKLWQEFREKLPPLSEEKKEEEFTFILLEIITFFEAMYERKFPCGEEAQAFALLEKIDKGFIYSKACAPLALRLFEVAHLLNPFLVQTDMVMAGYYYWAALNDDKHNYQKAKKIIEETLLLWPDSNWANKLRGCLSELLRIGSSEVSPNLFQARKVLEEGIEKFPKDAGFFRILMANQILEAGSDSRQSLRAAYEQLIPSIQAKEADGYFKKAVAYFKFLVASMGIEGQSIPPDAEDIREIVASVYQEKHFLEEAVDKFLSEFRIEGTKDFLYALQLSSFYPIALKAIKMLPAEKQAKIFTS